MRKKKVALTREISRIASKAFIYKCSQIFFWAPWDKDGKKKSCAHRHFHSLYLLFSLDKCALQLHLKPGWHSVECHSHRTTCPFFAPFLSCFWRNILALSLPFFARQRELFSAAISLNQECPDLTLIIW